jgi:hypothetical protein
MPATVHHQTGIFADNTLARDLSRRSPSRNIAPTLMKLLKINFQSLRLRHSRPRHAFSVCLGFSGYLSSCEVNALGRQVLWLINRNRTLY